MQAINVDRTQTVRVSAADIQWVPSPSQGVWRKMLEREGGEVARATTIVRFHFSTFFSKNLTENSPDLTQTNHSLPTHTGVGKSLLFSRVCGEMTMVLSLPSPMSAITLDPPTHQSLDLRAALSSLSYDRCVTSSRNPHTRRGTQKAY